MFIVLLSQLLFGVCRALLTSRNHLRCHFCSSSNDSSCAFTPKQTIVCPNATETCCLKTLIKVNYGYGNAFQDETFAYRLRDSWIEKYKPKDVVVRKCCGDQQEKLALEFNRHSSNFKHFIVNWFTCGTDLCNKSSALSKLSKFFVYVLMIAIVLLK